MTADVTEDFLEAFAQAWNRHDVEAILAAMTEDCLYVQSFGASAEGNRFEGREQARRGIEALFAAFPDARWEGARHAIAGDRGFSEWLFVGTGPAGRIEARGCDLFTFRDGLIAVKDSYRKQRSG